MKLKKKRVKVSLETSLSFFLQSPELKMPSNIIADHDMILTLLRFWIQILIHTNAGRYVTEPPLMAGQQVLFTVTMMESHTLLLL